MCNEYALRKNLDQLKGEFGAIRIPLSWAEAPNLEERASIRITDRAPIAQAGAGEGAELVGMRWSWPGPGGKPVYNFRSEGRRFQRDTRCLILADAFYEFTDPPPGEKRKTKWAFSLADGDLFAIAGHMHSYGDGHAFAMLTTDPGPDVAPYHKRQVVVLPPASWAAWLSGDPNEAELLAPAPGGTLKVSKA